MPAFRKVLELMTDNAISEDETEPLLLYLQHVLTSFCAIDVVSGYDLGNETTPSSKPGILGSHGESLSSGW